jgi:hypothetical protein
MTNEYRKHNDHDHEHEHNPAKYPHPNSDECEAIVLDPPKAPQYDPPKCDPPKCNCPDGGPSPSSNCITEMITTQDAEITAGEKATAFKKELQTILAKANAATQDYTRDKFTNLCTRWADEDSQIAELIRKLECTVTCWECVLECYVCSRLNELRDAQNWLDGDGKLPAEAHNLYDTQYWRTRDKEIKERRFNQIKNVLAAWETPAKTIDKILTDNAKLISEVSKSLGTEPGKAIYDIFFRLVPLHLAIAPVRGLNWKSQDADWDTNIDEQYTVLCKNKCDTGTPDPCCGVDLSDSSMLQRLIGPQPYLIDPNKLFDLICCLIKNRYEPANKVWATAVAALAEVTNRINNYKALIDAGLKSFDKDVRTAIPSLPDCDDCRPTDIEDEEST